MKETPPTALATRRRTGTCFQNGGRCDERSTFVFSQMGQNPIGPEGALSVITALSVNERHVLRTLDLKVCALPVTLHRIHSILQMTYLILSHLCGGSDPSKPGPVGLLAACSAQPYKPCQYRCDFSPIYNTHIFHIPIWFFQCECLSLLIFILVFIYTGAYQDLSIDVL